MIDWLIDPDLLDETTSMKDLQGLLANGNVLVIAKENSFSCIYFKDLERKPVSEVFEWNLVVTSNLLSTWGKSLTAHAM